MRFTNKAISIAVLAITATFACMNDAQAASLTNSPLTVYGQATKGSVTAKVTRGVNPTGTNGTQGAYSEFHNQNTTTIDFNSTTQVGNKAYTFGSALATYSFQNGMSTSSGRTGVYSDRWAPSGANGEINTSNYLAVFNGNKVTIDLTNKLNYFGIDWGALSAGNTFGFYSKGQLVSEFNYSDINPIAPVRARQHGGEGNGYLHFYANDSEGTFDQIVISQVGGGGFESDNHSFRISNKAFNFENGRDVPEPSMIIGLLATGGAILLKRSEQTV
jgi:hypothetical protein